MTDRKLEERLTAIEDRLSRVIRTLEHNGLQGPPPRPPFIGEPLTDEEIALAERESDELAREIDEEIARGGGSP